ncbi:MAG TPA: hypothetical protein VGL05_30490 [Kribbella sp.]
MNRARIAMAYQACEVADLAAAAVSLEDPAEAAQQAALVLAAAQRLVAAADRLGSSSTEDLGDPLQRFADKHPEEAAEDITDWSRRHAFRGLTSELQG